MAHDDSVGAGSILLAFILGAVSGAAVALLYAPQSGRETRELLGEKANEARARAADAAARGRDAINQGRETLTTAIERGREAYQQARARENACTAGLKSFWASSTSLPWRLRSRRLVSSSSPVLQRAGW
jgi:hypothetical protein